MLETIVSKTLTTASPKVSPGLYRIDRETFLDFEQRYREWREEECMAPSMLLRLNYKRMWNARAVSTDP